MKATLILVLVSLTSFATWSNPVDIGPPINPDAGSPTFATNGSFMIFASTRPGGLGWYDLWRSVRIGGVWQTPVNLGSNVNTADYDSGPFLAENATKLYFGSGGIERDSDIFFSQMSGMIPGPKVDLGFPINTPYREVGPVLTLDGNTMYYASDRLGSMGSGTYDIWTSTKSGGIWSNPTNLGNVVNTSEYEWPCWISSNGNTLVFCSTRSDGLGYGDIWYTVKTGGVWGTPINMGIPINSAGDEEFATFRCNYGQIGGIMYLTRLSTGNVENIYTSIESGFIEVEPASLGSIKVIYR